MGTLHSCCSLEAYILMSKRVNKAKSLQIVVRIVKKISACYGTEHDGGV